MRLKIDDNVCPRAALEAAEKSGKFSPQTIGKIRRRQGAEQNSWEGMPIILAAIVSLHRGGCNGAACAACAGIMPDAVRCRTV